MGPVKFTPAILELLRKTGFRYCYSKTTVDAFVSGTTYITLTPVQGRPDMKRLAEMYDTYFLVDNEPAQMAADIDPDITVYINLNDTLLKELYAKKDFSH